MPNFSFSLERWVDTRVGLVCPEFLGVERSSFWEKLLHYILHGLNTDEKSCEYYLNELTSPPNPGELEFLLFQRLDKLKSGVNNPLILLEIYYLEIALQFLSSLSESGCWGLEQPQFDVGEFSFSELPGLPYLYCLIPNSLSYFLIHGSLFQYLATNERRFLDYLFLYLSRFESARREQIQDFFTKLGQMLLLYPDSSENIRDIIRYGCNWSPFGDLLIPPILVIVPSLKDNPSFFREIFISAIKRWEKTDLLPGQVLADWLKIYQSFFEKIPPYAKVLNWGLFFVNPNIINGEADSHCYLRYFNEYNRINPFTGENLQYPNTHDHEGYGHGPFELLLLSIFSTLISELIHLNWSNLGSFDLSKEMDRFKGELRTSTIFGEAFAGYFCKDPRCIEPVGEYYPTFASVLNNSCAFVVGDQNADEAGRRRYELGYSAGPRFWMSIEIALQIKFEEWLQASKDGKNLSPDNQLWEVLRKIKLWEVLRKIKLGNSDSDSDSDLRMSVRHMLFLEMLAAFASVFNNLRSVELREIQGQEIQEIVPNLITSLATRCLNELLSRLQDRFGINRKLVEEIYNSLGSFDSLNALLSENYPDVLEFLKSRLGVVS